jgi:hypothetical protein
MHSGPAIQDQHYDLTTVLSEKALKRLLGDIVSTPVSVAHSFMMAPRERKQSSALRENSEKRPIGGHLSVLPSWDGWPRDSSPERPI